MDVQAIYPRKLYELEKNMSVTVIVKPLILLVRNTYVTDVMVLFKPLIFLRNGRRGVTPPYPLNTIPPITGRRYLIAIGKI
jgi:hypothetical protein